MMIVDRVPEPAPEQHLLDNGVGNAIRIRSPGAQPAGEGAEDGAGDCQCRDDGQHDEAQLPRPREGDGVADHERRDVVRKVADLLADRGLHRGRVLVHALRARSDHAPAAAQPVDANKHEGTCHRTSASVAACSTRCHDHDNGPAAGCPWSQWCQRSQSPAAGRCPDTSAAADWSA